MLPSDIDSAGTDGALSYTRLFAAPLLDPDRPAPPIVSGPGGKACDRRFAVYRNNVTVSLVEALAAIYPATRRITGADFFFAMARFHIRETPPTSPLLFEYGHGLPAFIERYEHARSMPWLADVARIERAWLDAYHAADMPTLAREALSGVAPENLGELRFQAHPATRLLCSAYPAFSIFSVNRNDAPVGRIAATEPECTLVTRPDHEVEVRPISAGAAAMLANLIAGAPLAEAAGEALASSPRFDLSAAIAGMIAAGAFSGITRKEEEPDDH